VQIGKLGFWRGESLRERLKKETLKISWMMNAGEGDEESIRSALNREEWEQ